MTASAGSTDKDAVEAWLQDFAAAVRERDYERARGMFHTEVSGFGTVARRFHGIDELAREQWQRVWGDTESFRFDLDSAEYWREGDLVVAISEWSSDGIEPDGSRRPRTGRATIVLSGSGDGVRAAHTHFSLTPRTPAA
jgi:ketosteroid isomerase-like protein